MRRTIQPALPILGLLVASCASYPSVIREFDSIAGYQPLSMKEPDRLAYGDRADRYPWLFRSIEWSGLGELLATVFAFEAEPHEVEEPASFARDRIADMARVAGKELVRISEVAWRLLMVLEKDETPLNRATAIEQLGALLVQLEGEVTASSPGFRWAPQHEAEYQTKAKKLVEDMQKGWPSDATRDQDLRDTYATALRDLALLDPGTLEQERSRLRLLTGALTEENDAEIHRLIAGYLVRSLRAAGRHALAIGAGEIDARVRSASITAIWKSGRAVMLPWVLHRLTERTKALLPPALAATEPFDEDANVRRLVLRYCWAVDFEEAKRQHSSGPSPLAALVDAAINDPDRSLRTLAREALAFHVRRPVDPTGAWIPAWWRDFVSGTGRSQ